MNPSEFHSFLIKTGIAACGVVDASRPLTYDAYCSQIAKGIPQNLGYLQRNAFCREGFEAIMPGTKSVLCFGIAMPKMPASAPCHFARFCAIGDYHTVLRDRIGQILHFLKDHFPIENSRICVDTAPVLERELAIRAGFGSIGYNHMIIHPQWGSYISLGELLVDVDLMPYREMLAFNTSPLFDPQNLIPGAVGCCPKHCRQCVRACPTGALSSNGYDVNRCLAYWTIQHRGIIPKEFAKAMGNVIWGCDRCQQGCPRIRDNDIPAPEDNPLSRITLKEILTLSGRQLRIRVAQTVIADVHPYMLQRNACIVIANTGKRELIPELENVAQNHACEWVRSTAQSSLNILTNGFVRI